MLIGFYLNFPPITVTLPIRSKNAQDAVLYRNLQNLPKYIQMSNRSRYTSCNEFSYCCTSSRCFTNRHVIYAFLKITLTSP